MLVYLSMIETETDKDKFEQIYKKYKNLMYHVAYQILQNHHDAEDAVHHAFVSVIKHLDKIDATDSPKTKSFIVLITERKAIDIIRTSHRDQLTSIDEAIGGIPIPPPGDHGLADALAKLPAAYREIILLKYDNGYTTKELSKMLSLSESGVRKLVARAKCALEKELEGETCFEKPIQSF